MNASPQQAGRAFVVYRWDDAPHNFRAMIEDDVGPRHSHQYVILTVTDNLEQEGIPFWVDVMNPMEVFRRDLENGITVLAA